MKTLKYNGKEYQVIDIYFMEGNVHSMKLTAVIKYGGCLDVVILYADYYVSLGYSTISVNQQLLTQRTLKILAEC